MCVFYLFICLFDLGEHNISGSALFVLSIVWYYRRSINSLAKDPELPSFSRSVALGKARTPVIYEFRPQRTDV